MIRRTFVSERAFVSYDIGPRYLISIVRCWKLRTERVSKGERRLRHVWLGPLVVTWVAKR